MIQFSQDIHVQHRHLHLPIRDGAESIHMQILLDGRVVRDFTVELAIDGPRQWWSYYDIWAFHGKTITLQTVEACLMESQAKLLQQMITQSDSQLVSTDLYRERYRPQIHFTPRRGWSNDPNGLVYAEGIWHMFYQWNPFGVRWGNMHWGHATSKNLLQWDEQPVALFQRSLLDMAFSGGGLVDRRNTSEFGILGEEPIVLSFTSTGRGECLAYSLDGGKTFLEYNGNPILAHQGRDPKIIWYEPLKKWMMIVYDEQEAESGYLILDSQNLKQWTAVQFLPGWYECPELFDLPVIGGEPGERKWVVYGAILNGLWSTYQLGDFNGTTFTPEGERQPGHAGPHFYAAQIFNHAPGDRRIMVGWLRDATYPGMPFGNGMSVPIELSLRKNLEEMRLCFYPVMEIDALRVAIANGVDLSIRHANELLANAEGDLFDLEMEIEFQNEYPVRLDIGGYPLLILPGNHEVTFMGKRAFVQPGSTSMHLRVLIDRSVTEVFIDRGWAAFSAMTIFGSPDKNECKLCLEGEAQIRSFALYKLRSIWNE
jgi:fructan beta-fructosidase